MTAPVVHIRVAHLDKYQHYKKRNPPWIKMYFRIWQDRDFLRLHDASKLLAIGLLSLASQYDNKIPFDPPWIHKILSIDGQFEWEVLLESGFIEPADCDASALLAKCPQVATPETETETETENKNRLRAERSSVCARSTDNISRRMNGTWRNDEEFLVFWSHYPRKEKPEMAWKAFRKLSPDPILFQQMIDWIDEAQKSDQWREDKTHVPHPTTFLNQKYWEGEIPPCHKAPFDPKIFGEEKDDEES